MDQTEFLTRLENELEIQLTEVILVFQNLDEKTLLHPSPTGGWSMASCIEHLNTYALFYVPKLEAALEKSSRRKITSNLVFNYSLIGKYFINMMDIERGNKKYKAMKIHRPDTSKEPYQILVNFIQHLEKLQLLIRKSDSYDLKRISIPTSISRFVKMNFGEVLQFILVHNKRHLAQARKNSREQEK